MFSHCNKCLFIALLAVGLAAGCSDPDSDGAVNDIADNTNEPDVSVDADVDDGADTRHPDAALPDATLPDATSPDAAVPDVGSEDTSDDGSTTQEPYVAFLWPENGATVDNPVRFHIDANGIDEVEIFADETYSLGPAFNPTDQNELLYRFAGTGNARSLHVVGRAGGVDVARENLTITVNPDTCEDRFFITWFGNRNEDPSGTLDLFAIREASLAAVKAEIAALQACGAGLTLGGMMALLLYEGAFRAGAFNTRCNENSYHNTPSNCDAVAEALYSYQFGIGAIHTSNFHPCRGGSYTQGMRQKFADAAAAAGYPVGEDLITPALATRFAEVCPDATPTTVDYYILGAHEPFGIPRNSNGNALETVGHFPFMDPDVSVQLTFAILHGACATIGNDRDAISRWGGGDARYSLASKQDEILAYYGNFKAANCD